jgi:hypothetical protein
MRSSSRRWADRYERGVCHRLAVRDSRQVLGDYETEVGAAGQAQAAMQSACIMEFKLQLASRTLKRELLKNHPTPSPSRFQARSSF